MGLWKRVFLMLAAAAMALGILAAGTLYWLYSSADTSNVGDLSFTNELRVPPLLAPTESEGRKVFELSIGSGESQLLPGKSTPTWGINGAYLSPTLRASRGDEVEVNVANDLDEDTTTLHWHGMELPAEMDGGPHQLIAPGEVWRASWKLSQPAATLWFHPHPHGSTTDHVYRGVTGMFIVDDEDSNSLPLPREYGIDDVPLVVQDKAFNADGTLRERRPVFASLGPLGDEILVNGTYDPYFIATTTLVRFRILNASPARTYDFGLADDRPFQVIATDSGLLRNPVESRRIQLSPGERAEIVMILVPGETATLRSFGADLGHDFFTGRFSGEDDTFDILQIRAADELKESPGLPANLSSWDDADSSDAIVTRSFRLGGRGINGKSMDLTRVDEVVRAGSSEVWEVRSNGGHSFHPHLVRFLILDIDGEEPGPLLSGWKDTVQLAPGKTYRLLIEFPSHADADSPFMFHCHILEHEDDGMMGQFVVIGDDEPPDHIPNPFGNYHSN